jgi:hypothetical protein
MRTTEKQYPYECKRGIGQAVEVRSEDITAATRSSTMGWGVMPQPRVHISMKHIASIFKPSYQTSRKCRIFGFLTGDYEEFYILGCNSV